MTNTKDELVQAGVDAGFDRADLEAMTKIQILGLLGAS
jgi:hypothetical protein